MYPHPFADALAVIVRVNHIARIGNMTSKVNVIGFENIGADDFIFFFSNECIHGGAKPMLIQIFPGCIRQENIGIRSEEHTSELQSRGHLVCRLLLEKKKNQDGGE